MAFRCYDESIAIFAASQYSTGSGFPLLCRGYLWIAEGDPRQAEGDFRLCIQAADKYMWTKLVVRAVAGLAEAAYLCGDLARSGKLFGAAAKLDAEAIKLDPLSSSARARFAEIYEFRRSMAAACERRHNSIFDAARQEGSRFTLVEAIALGLES